MVKNQLFRILPDTEIISTLLSKFGLQSLQDTNYFTKDTLEEIDTLDNLVEIKDVLDTYYLPCKSRVYLNNITINRCITILKQFIKVHGYTLISKERYINRKKVCVYRLIELEEKITTPKKKKGKDIVISFE